MRQIILTTPEELEHILVRILQSNLSINYSTPTTSEKQVLNIDEASEFLQIPKNTLYGYTSRRLIPHQKIGRSLKFRRDVLKAWMEENKRKTKKEILESQNAF